jgi:hypothetical protein
MKGSKMAFQWKCGDCNETFREDTAEGLIKRAAAHNHEHHGGPAEITPELEAALRGGVTEV